MGKVFTIRLKFKLTTKLEGVNVLESAVLVAQYILVIRLSEGSRNKNTSMKKLSLIAASALGTDNFVSRDVERELVLGWQISNVS